MKISTFQDARLILSGTPIISYSKSSHDYDLMM